jgi:hypothetical protein
MGIVIKMSALKTVLGEWEDVYCVQEVTPTIWTEMRHHEDTLYYQTYGGGPEGGYFVKVKMGEGDDLNCASCDTVWRVRRSWFQPFTVEEVKNVVFEYEPAREGTMARCRLIEVYPIGETRAILDAHSLSGDAAEIVKALRDGLNPKVDANYKDLCLAIILDHFCQIDKYLDLLPSDTCGALKKNLIALDKAQKEKDEERESVASSDSE